MTTTTHNSVGCVKAATEILGDKWTPQLLRFFINEEKVRFCQLQDLATGINPRTLTSLSRCEYSLTSKGRDLMPIIFDMEAWSVKYAPVHA
jgi:DNA-binding HxlR family transcriptional regulator